MENNYGKAVVSVDSKGRIIIPSMFFFPIGEDVTFLESENDIFDIYLVKRLDHLVEMLIEKKYNSQSEQQFKIIENQIKMLLNRVNLRVKVNSQRRVILPSLLRANSEIFLLGNYDSVRLFPSKDSFDDYSNNLKLCQKK